MTSLFDTREFTERLFFPRADVSPPPPGAVDLDVAGEATLHVRWHRGGAARPTLLLFHGNGEVVADYDALAPRFAAAGVDLAVMDYRGYGRSGGAPSLRSMLADAPRVLAAVRAAGAIRLVVMGRSLGSACAAALYADAPAGVVGVVLESGFVDLGALVRRRGLAAPAVLSDADRAAFDPLPRLARGTLPLLVLHGEADAIIDPGEAARAHAAAGARRKQLALIPGHGHNDLARAPRYWATLAAFVADVAG